MNNYLRAISTNFIFFTINVFFFLVVTPLAIKTMGAELYGLWVILLALMLLSNIGNLGTDTIVMKLSAEAQDPFDGHLQTHQILSAGYFIVLVMAMITAALLLGGTNLIVNNFNINVDLREQFHQALFWIAASIVPQFLTRVPHGYLLSQLRNRAARQIELISSISLWTGAIVIALLDKDLVSVAAWCFFNNCIVFGLYFRASQQLIPFRLLWHSSTIKKMLRMSRYLFLECLAITLFQQFDKVVLGFTLGPAIAGVYSIGTSLALRLSMVTGQATEVMIPYASLKESLDDRERLYAVFRQLSRYISLMLAGMSSFLIIWMYDILSIWISTNFAISYANVFRILIIAYGWLSMCRPAEQTLTGLGKVKFTAIVYFSSTILMLVGVFFLSRNFGIIGAVASNLVLVLLLLFNIYLYFTFEGVFPLKHILVDLHWGLFLPILIYGLSLLLPDSMLSYKLMETIILVIIFSLIIAKDDFLLKKIKNFLEKQPLPKSLV
jgi:O-antigen/teichoic acid export membrane protein